MLTFKWVEIVLYLAVIQGLFLSFSLPRLKKANKKANSMLSLLLLSASVSVFLFLNTIGEFNFPIQVHAFLDTFPFLFGPLLYFYLKKLMFPKEKIAYPLLHFLPALLHFTFALSKFTYSQEEFSRLLSSRALLEEWTIIFTVLVTSICVYWLAALRLIMKFKKQNAKVVAFKKNLRFLTFFLVAIAGGYAICILFSLDFFFDVKFFAFTGSNVGWIFIPLIIYFISYNALIQPEALTVSYYEGKRSVARIKKEELSKYQYALEKVMKEERQFLDPMLKSSDIAKKIGLETTRFSWLINEIYGSNFYDFVNGYRIKEFLHLIGKREHEKKTLEALAYEVGFNSKTTFNKSFRKVTGNTPSAYIQNLKHVEHSGETSFLKAS